MKSLWITTIFLVLITMGGFWMQVVAASEILLVQFGSTVTMQCNISYFYDTTWFKHNTGLTPTLVLSASLKEGQLFQEKSQVSSNHSEAGTGQLPDSPITPKTVTINYRGEIINAGLLNLSQINQMTSLDYDRFQLSPRFSVTLMNRSLALTIANVEEGDLGLYYCVANLRTHLTVGKGIILQGSSVPLSQFDFRYWHCVAVVSGVLIMVLAVCIIDWKAKSKKKTTKKAHTAQVETASHNSSDIVKCNRPFT